MSAYGVPKEIMGKIMGIGWDTLNKHYEHELETGLERSNIVVANKLFQAATLGRGKEAGEAQRFWLTRRSAAFKDIRHNINELSGPDGGPIETVNVPLTDDERAIRLHQLFVQKALTIEGEAKEKDET